MNYHGPLLNFTCHGCIPKLETLRPDDSDSLYASAEEDPENHSPDGTSTLIASSNKDVIANKDGHIPARHKKRKPRKTQHPISNEAQRKEELCATNSSKPENRSSVARSLDNNMSRTPTVLDQNLEATLVPVTDQRKNKEQSKTFTEALIQQGRKMSPRNQCLIILNIPESTAETSQTRLDDDVKALRQCLAPLFVEGEELVAAAVKVKGAFRLGRRHEEPQSHPRPLKIVLGSPEEAQSILKRAHRLKGQAVRILRDLSPEDRIKLKQALTELRNRQALGETNLFIRDFRVLKRKPRIRWMPLLPLDGLLEMTQSNAQ